MSKELDFEYTVVKHYLHKGVFARAQLIQQLINDLRLFENKENFNSQPCLMNLNDDEVVAVLQISIISHIMMFVEDLTVISKSISEGEIDYYKYLDKSGDDDLGVVIGEFFDKINNEPDETFEKILSYANLNNFEFANDSEKEIIRKIMDKMIARVRIFFNKVTFFRQNHIKIFRRYKHAGFPILLVQQIPEVMKEFTDYSFASVGLTSRQKIDEELVPIPYSKKVVESYQNIKDDIFSFLGVVLHFKLICLERGVKGLIPNTSHTFRIDLNEEEKNTLDQVWKKFEIKHPFTPEEKYSFQVSTKSEILRWYTEIENFSKRVL